MPPVPVPPVPVPPVPVLVALELVGIPLPCEPEDALAPPVPPAPSNVPTSSVQLWLAAATITKPSSRLPHPVLRAPIRSSPRR